MKRALVLLALMVWAEASAQSTAAKFFPRGCRDRSCMRDRVLSSGAVLPPWTLNQSILFAQPAALPPCSVEISGAFDSTCVFQCLPYGDGGINCYDNTGAPIGTMAQPTTPTAPVLSNSPLMLADGGWYQQWNNPDDTAGTSGMAHVTATAVQNFFGGPHTLIYEGNWGSTSVDPTGWLLGAGTAANQMQLRRAGPSQIEFLETPNVAASSGTCIDNFCVLMAKRESDGGINLTQGDNKSDSVLTTMVSLTSLQALDIGGYNNIICCSPQGSGGGAFGSLTGYGPDDAGQAKADSFYSYVTRSAFGALGVASGPGSEIGNIATRIARYDLDKPGGGLPVLGVGDYLMDRNRGGVTNQIYHLLGPVDPLDGGVLGGSAIWRGHTDQGPLYHWKHQNTAGWLSSEDGGLAWEELGTTAGDGGFIISTNAYFIGTAFTDGGYTVSDRYWIQNVCTGGTIDGGYDHCAGTVAGNGVFARYPDVGCPMVCSNATGAIKSLLYAGNDAGQTAGLEVQQIQMTDTLEVEEPSVTNAQVSAQWLSLDAGSYIPHGCMPGKIVAVFTPQYSSSWYPTTLTAAIPPGTGSYLYDISNTTVSHDMLQWATIEVSGDTQDAGNVSTMDAVMYPDDSNYINPNKFAQGGQYNGAPLAYTAGLFMATSLEWDVEIGTQPDGGTGQGSRLIERADICPDQSNPLQCQPQTIIRQNVDQMGLCPGTPDTFEIGTRALGTGPSTSRVHHINVCGCSGSKCQGDCK